MVMQIRGTLNPNTPPTGLAERQLSVEMGSTPPKLWCGVPASVDASERLQLSPPIDYISNALLATALGDFLPLTGGALSGTLTLPTTASLAFATGTGFLELTGGTLSGPGNLVVNGTLAVSNSDTVSASVTNTGSGATGLKITSTGAGNLGLEIQGGQSLIARGPAQIHPGYGTEWYFSSSLIGMTSNTTANLIDLSQAGAGGGIFIRTGGRANDPAGIYAFAVSRNGTRNTLPFIQMFDASGVGAAVASVPGRPLGSIWFGGYDNTSMVNPYHPHELRSAAIWVEPSETWSGTGHGSRMLFDVTANGTTTAQTVMTLGQDGALRLSSAQPAVVWDVTGADPRQWEVRAINTRWGTWNTADNSWHFTIDRDPGPPVSYSYYMRGFCTVAGGFHATGGGGFGQGLNVTGFAQFNNDVTLNGQLISSGGFARFQRVGNDPMTDVPAISFQRSRMLPGDYPQAGDLLAILSFVSSGSGGPFRTAAIQAAATENHAPSTMGSELQFWNTPNGGLLRNAMTLGEDANLTVVGTVTASGTLLTSNPELKDNISQAPSGALAKVCELPVIDFRWKHGRDSKLHRGFSADDVRRVMGEDSGCSAAGAYSLADMNAVLWQAVQELSAQVQELERRIH